MTPTNGTTTKPRADERVIVNNFYINHPDDELEKYQGLFVAWSMDGRKVLASGKTPTECSEDVVRNGVDPGACVYSYIDGPNDLPLA